ncbi:hypothetical protein OF83DRAFT_1093778 [Amylostereum chailletii]|nr:hypothetical protein OF83DRAFT_1093778 [Amylostereum chailletii]
MLRVTGSDFPASAAMATVTHYIRSDYDPEIDRQRLLRETGQPLDEPVPPEDADLAWQTGSSFGLNRRIVLAPRFVPATLSYDEWGNVTLPANENATSNHAASDSDGIGGWYRSLRRAETAPSTLRPTKLSPSPRSQLSPSSPSSKPSTISARSFSASDKRHERDWFISRVLDHPASLPPSPAPSSSLADILSREPPASKPHKPPVFLHLGPSNKGWAMLQNQGWSEGEGLGGSGRRPRKRARSTPPPDDITRPDTILRADIEKPRTQPPPRAPGPAPKLKLRREELVVDDDIVEVKHTPVIDLTCSDSDDDDEMVPGGDPSASRTIHAGPASISLPASPSPSPGSPLDNDVSEPYSSTQTALLTPLPTVLKSDRLGIGLKAKTEGPYRSSVKRVTHNAASLAAHTKAAEEARRTKEVFGRGKRGFQRMEKRERQERQDLIAYMNR